MNNYLQKAQEKFGDRLDYSKVVYRDCKTKIIIVCKKHGESLQSPEVHVKSKFGCPKCATEHSHCAARTSNEEFIKKAKKVHGDKYAYDKVIYSTNYNKVIITCPKHGDFLQQPNNHLMGKGCQGCKSDSLRVRFSHKDIFVEKAKKIFGNRFDYSKINYINCDYPVNISCLAHNESFFQTPFHHLKGLLGCKKCSSERQSLVARKPNSYFKEALNKVHGENPFPFEIVRQADGHPKVKVFCKKHGESISCVQNAKAAKFLCPICGLDSESSWEKKLSEFLTNNGINFIKNSRSITGFELDIFIPDKKIAIEFDGNYWHSELNGKDKHYHLRKTNLCEKAGIRLIHIFESEANNTPRVIFSKLGSIVGLQTKKIYARKCKVFEISQELKTKFINKYHLQGDAGSTINLGLFYKKRLVSVMTFCKKRVSLGQKTSIDGEYELLRFCSIFNFNIIGAAGKLLAAFERKFAPSSIISYADKRWSTGNVYKVLGFLHLRDSKPSYWYFSKGSPNELIHRFSFRKNVLSKRLANFDNNKTEWENMVNNGYNRIWDCGTMVFEKKYESR